MSLSAYAIRDKIWLVATERVAEPDCGADPPLGSIMLTPDDAYKLSAQIYAAQRAVRQRFPEWAEYRES